MNVISLCERQLAPASVFAWVITEGLDVEVWARPRFRVEEWQTLAASSGSARRNRERIWGRLAAKEAVRRLLDRLELPRFDLESLRIENDVHGRPVLRQVGASTGSVELPQISIAHTAGVAVSLATVTTTLRIGVDVERVLARPPRVLELALEPGGLAALERMDLSDAEKPAWSARLWCAKEAVGKATGRGLIVGPASVAILDADAGSGRVVTALGPQLASACPELATRSVLVQTGQRDGLAWAWTLGEGG